jgi:hypothetical protein
METAAEMLERAMETAPHTDTLVPMGTFGTGDQVTSKTRPSLGRRASALLLVLQLVASAGAAGGSRSQDTGVLPPLAVDDHGHAPHGLHHMPEAAAAHSEAAAKVMMMEAEELQSLLDRRARSAAPTRSQDFLKEFHARVKDSLSHLKERSKHVFREHVGGPRHLATFAGMAYLFALVQVSHANPDASPEEQLVQAGEIAFGAHGLEALAAFTATEVGLKEASVALLSRAELFRSAGQGAARSTLVWAGKGLGKGAPVGAFAVVNGVIGSFDGADRQARRLETLCPEGERLRPRSRPASSPAATSSAARAPSSSRPWTRTG